MKIQSDLRGNPERLAETTSPGIQPSNNSVRGEMEMGLDARPAVYSGYFALVEDVTP